MNTYLNKCIHTYICTYIGNFIKTHLADKITKSIKIAVQNLIH